MYRGKLCREKNDRVTTKVFILSQFVTMKTSYYGVAVFVFLLTGLSWALQNRIFVVPDNATVFHQVSPCPEQCHSLRDVLAHHELFFTSNTTIELLPGQYVVNESFGNIVIEDIEHFTMFGVKGSTVHCTTYGTLGLYFLNVTNVSISSIHLSHCNGDKHNGRVLHLIEAHSRSYTFYLEKCTLVFVTSTNISVHSMTVVHANGVGLSIFGAYSNFQLSQSTFSHNRVNCVIFTLSSNNFSIHEYRVVDSWFAYGNATENGTRIASGISVENGRTEISIVRLQLFNVTLTNNRARQGNLMLRGRFVRASSIAIHNVTSKNTGADWLSNMGLVINVFNSDVHLDVSIENGTFFGSCISMLSMQIIELTVHFTMRNIIVEEASCSCDHAVLIYDQNRWVFSPPRYRHLIENLSVINSCGSESLVKVYMHQSSSAHTRIILQGNNNFLNNKGTILFQHWERITFKSNTTIANSSSAASPIRLENTKMVINGNILFQNNVGEQSGGIILISSVILLSRSNMTTLTFIGNRGHNGGALALYDSSLLYIGSNMVFEDNVALNYGGAIFVDDASYQSGKYNNRLLLKCFYGRTGRSNIEFTNNTALAGNGVFGGWVDFCSRRIRDTPIVFHLRYDNGLVFKLNNTNEELSAIASNPSRVCLCTNSIPHCSITRYKYEQPLFHGQSFHVPVVAVGQRFGTVASTVIAKFVGNASVDLDDIQQVQNVGRNCTTLNYTVKSPNDEETLLLTVQNNFVPEPDLALFQNKPYYKEQLLVFDQLHITLKISMCPLGFSLDNLSNTCACQEPLAKHGIYCYIQNQTVVRRNQIWINATFVHTVSEMGNPGVILHQNCPFDYCKNLDQQYLDLRYPDDQCAFGRSGILCGGCPQNYSHVFGTSRCKECSNIWTILVLSLFVLSGIGLTALLILLNLTVSVGTINGLIFYAHIVRANQAAFFPPQMTNPFLSWFIAWLNLDLGIEMCFFDSLDAYIKTWLQFLFPIYHLGLGHSNHCIKSLQHTCGQTQWHQCCTSPCYIVPHVLCKNAQDYHHRLFIHYTRLSGRIPKESVAL